MKKKFESLIIILLLCLLAFFLYARFVNENKVLKQIISRLEADSRLAQVLVTEVKYDEQKQKNITTIKFLEYDVSGLPMIPKYFSFYGNIIQFQSLVIRFDDLKIRNADKLKGKSAALFLKVFLLYGKDTQEYQELQLLHTSTMELIKNQDISGAIKGRLNINSQISDVLNLAKKEVIICTSVEEFKNRIKLLEPIIKILNKNAVKMIIALNGDSSEISMISEKIGVKIKNIEINTSFYIADKTEILFMLNNSEDKQDQMAIWFSSPFFVQSFAGLFDLALRRGK